MKRRSKKKVQFESNQSEDDESDDDATDTIERESGSTYTENDDSEDSSVVSPADVRPN